MPFDLLQRYRGCSITVNVVSYVKDSKTKEERCAAQEVSETRRLSVHPAPPRPSLLRSVRVTRVLAQPGSPVPGRQHHATRDSAGRVGKPEGTRQRRPPGPPSSPRAHPTNQPAGHLRSLGFPFLFRKRPEGSSARRWPGSVARMSHRGVPRQDPLSRRRCPLRVAMQMDARAHPGRPRRHFSSPPPRRTVSPPPLLLLLRHERVPLSSTPCFARTAVRRRRRGPLAPLRTKP